MWTKWCMYMWFSGNPGWLNSMLQMVLLVEKNVVTQAHWHIIQFMSAWGCSFSLTWIPPMEKDFQQHTLNSTTPHQVLYEKCIVTVSSVGASKVNRGKLIILQCKLSIPHLFNSLESLPVSCTICFNLQTCPIDCETTQHWYWDEQTLTSSPLNLMFSDS